MRTPSNILTRRTKPLLVAVFATALAIFLGLLASRPVAAQTPAEAALLEMAAAAKRGDKRALAQLLPRVRGHVLEAWGSYFELKSRLDEASSTEVQSFFKQHAGTYVEDRLRNDWLLLLGQRRDLSAFEAEHANFRMRDDKEVACYAAAIDFVKTGRDVADDVKRNWYALKEADDACTFAAGRLLDAKLLTPDDVWREVRLSVEANRVRAASRAFELVAPQQLAVFGEAMANPAKYLQRSATGGSLVSKELATLALIRIASTDAPAGANAMERWASGLPAAQRHYVWAVIGKQSASRLDASAVDYFAKAGDEDLGDDLLGWKVRAALRTGQWRTVGNAIDAMTPATQKEPIWAYWKARSLLAQNPGASTAAVAPRLNASGVAVAQAPSPGGQARALLLSIASARGFYEQLASEALGQKIVAPPRPPEPSAQEMAAARSNPGLQRALAAIALGLRAEGVREWNYTTSLHERGGMNERELLAAAQLACEREVWDRCINTSERTKEAFDVAQRFPMPFRDAVVKRAREIGADPAAVYGLIRQESRFIMDARSHVGASGLMQVMPATAKWTAKKIGMTDFKATDITDRDVNIAIGTAYFKLVLDDMGGSLALAAAAYNAGPSRPRAWRQGPVMEAAIWAENVPFAETRDYVKKVLSNATVYASVISGQPQSLLARLGRVGPRDATAPVEDKALP